MAILLQRVCWNSKGWRHPTGELYGKEASYVGKYGFGHEEWNFNTSDLIDGTVHGYAYYRPPEHQTNRYSEAHQIYFFSIRPDKIRVLVGRYRNVRFLTASETEGLKKSFRASPILGR